MKTLLLLPLLALPLAGQEPPRAIRRTVPITRSFERALRLGTRDSTGHPGARYWQLTTDYRIDARLDAVAGRVTGHATITIHNPSDSALKQLVLRLYQNRFNPWAPRSRVPPSITGGTVLYRLNANGEEVDVKSMAAQWAASTVLGLTLANPIPARGTGTVEVDWAGDIPDIPQGRGSARGGRRGLRIFQLAQWYPQVAVYDDLRGWDREPHLGGSEFYNNFGRFEVNLDLPGGYLVGATGTLTNPDEVLAPMVRERLASVLESDSQRTIVGEGERGPSKATRGGSRLVWRFVADTVNDFAWAASADFVWDATRATIPGRGPIPVHVLYLPENTRYRQTGALARHALEFYSTLWFPYAFPQFTQVDGPENGMEYPMLTMSGPGFGVTDHEIGHQWWPMMVSNNETWYGWMDEGFNEYMNVLSEAAHEGRPPVLDSLGGRAGALAGNESQAPMMWDNNYGGPLTTYVTYSKAPMMLSMLGALVGDSAVARAMKAYAADWRFRHPSPWDFMFAMNRELGRNLDWFWYSWLFTTESVDGGIERVVERGRAWEVTVRQRGEMPAPIVLAATLAPGGPSPRLPRNAVLRGDTVTVTWPVETWFDGRRSRPVTLDFGGRRITAVTLDPGARFPDRDRTDNRWPR
ncbi:MAG: M1 family metallopeptidase [Gemmatimonadetes bacterium]|nr:M1 family metallopeptidase [Gemmatimonadota bacterium]MBK7349614.1 M1 family metallopeptidase [Gemmatimonadota bacterium]MBK7784244.1 M1 family metallopeptidase [Gemmatimonadota bacterium]MBK7925173.1 M1 family metallopeptidase [Gemmatimonadota bacterium]MBK9067710.1 M1 family metallopeptidase [Gemmatimonadota bacterium]